MVCHNAVIPQPPFGVKVSPLGAECHHRKRPRLAHRWSNLVMGEEKAEKKHALHLCELETWTESHRKGAIFGGCVSSNLKETMPQTPRKTAKISVVNSTRWLLLFFWGRRGKGGKVHCSLVKNRWLFIAVICCHCHCCHFVAILPLSLSLCLPSVLGISLKSSCYFCRPGKTTLKNCNSMTREIRV